jgi:hypothetical protein
MSRITIQQVKGWLSVTKVPIGNLDTDLLDELENEVLIRLAVAYDVTAWTSITTTPPIVRTIIAKMYAAWFYDKTYSEDGEGVTEYGDKLRANAEMLISGLSDGTLQIPGETPLTSGGAPGFYPTDESSAMEPESDDMSLGPAAFSMGVTF